MLKKEIIVTSLENIAVLAHRDCNINIRLKSENTIVFHSLKNYETHQEYIMQELDKFNFKINVMPHRFEKMS